jgi:L-histidine N-alpha-methyltransferase
MFTDAVAIHIRPEDAGRALRADARAGLAATPKWIPSRWFYDARGSELFDRITTLPEYYPTRAEREILTDRAADIAGAARAGCLIELGSGSAEKTRGLIDALCAVGTLRRFIPLDVSTEALRSAVTALRAEYPTLSVEGVVADFTVHLDLLPDGTDRMVVFLGGTIGNLPPAERARFYKSVRNVLTPGERLLVGADLVKDPATLIAAYDDADGVTAEFNRNVLRVLNRELDGNLAVDAFDHVAVWDAEREWIEMRLRAREPIRGRLAAIDLDLEFAPGEELRTEISAKFRPERLEGELRTAGFEITDTWTDRADRYLVTLARAV